MATTRPETMLGDTAVAVNPDDERYKDMVGKTVILPIVHREIPIIADEYVEMEFGTGVVAGTPFPLICVRFVRFTIVPSILGKLLMYLICSVLFIPVLVPIINVRCVMTI